LNKRAIIWGGVIFLLAVGLGVFYFTRGNKEISEINSVSPVSPGKPTPQEGSLAPPFVLSDLQGKMIGLGNLRGKVVLLNFWATWCGPCKREIPSLERLYQKRRDKGFVILAVNAERTSTSTVSSFADKYGMSFPVLLNPQADVANSYWIRAIPTSFLLDKKGVIRWKIVGGREWDNSDVLERVDQLLGE
jgi:thiol-disulfide isomerase/thioredoxin